MEGRIGQRGMRLVLAGLLLAALVASATLATISRPNGSGAYVLGDSASHTIG